MEYDILIVCYIIILNISIIVIIGCPILNCMIHFNACNDKGKYCAILWASGNYCGQLDLVIPLAHRVDNNNTSPTDPFHMDASMVMLLFYHIAMAG